MKTQEILDFLTAENLLGKPFSYTGEGPDSFNCYTLVKYFYEKLDGVIIPDYINPKTSAEIGVVTGQVINKEWATVEDFAGSMLCFKMPKYGAHVALSLGNGKFVHVWERSNGVAVERLQDWQQRLIGIYKYNGN